MKNLEKALTNPYFARIEFKANDVKNAEKIYIGKTNIFDEDSNIAVVDWRAPISSIYYDGKIGRTQYECPEGIIEGDFKISEYVIYTHEEIMQILSETLQRNCVKESVEILSNILQKRVQYIHTNGFEEKIQNIENRINYLKSKGYKNITIITKDYEESNKINEKLIQKNIDVELISEKLKKFSGGITIVPSFLSKGLEFDSVIISDYKSYDESILDTKLLYVAFTRAMHTLDVYI